jgi:NADPH-dependent 2,4-dienoyl-CoA reductase/sulfur reductase-like enzyme/rhodanese-related sulfurtransferase
METIAKSNKRVVIVGGVAGGMSAAARLRRLSEELEIIVLERGGYVSFANCGLPYYLGGEISDQANLVLQTPESLKARFNLDVRINSEVTHINSLKKEIRVNDKTKANEYTLAYDDLILSVGAKPIRPNLPGIDLPGIFTLRSLEDLSAIDHWMAQSQAQRVAIAGGGFIGLEVAEQLKERGMEVALIDGQEHVLAPLDPEMAGLVEKEMSKNGVELYLKKRVLGFKEGTDGSLIMQAGDNSGDDEENPKVELACDMVIMGLGVRPEVDLARAAGITIGELGGIRVDERLATSDPAIWAVGDAIEVKQPISDKYALIALGGPANRQGRMVANNIMGGNSRYTGSIGTAVLRVFSLTVASTGLNEKKLQAENIPYANVHIHPSQHAGYYPGAKRIDLKVLFHKENGLILGAQAIGVEGVEKRIDVIATAIKAKMTVEDLADLELAYAPPFGSAKDPVNLAGMAALNILEGLVKQIQWPELALQKNALIIDVRSKREREAGFVAGSINIPLDQIRQEAAKLPCDQNIYLYCQSGQRSYFAARQLSLLGRQAVNISGGYLTYLTQKAPAKTLAGAL